MSVLSALLPQLPTILADYSASRYYAESSEILN